jgi:hypothetical protein
VSEESVFIARLGPDDVVAPGHSLTLSVDTRKLYLFDADSGVTLLA